MTQTRQNEQQQALVSVVIPTLNAASLLQECLESIKHQTYFEIEIIVVDGHSADNTLDIAQKYAITYVYGPDQARVRAFGGPFQRNYGAERAKGKYVYYVDADMRLMPELIEECVARIESEKADAIIVPEHSYGEGYWSKCRVLEKACYNTDNLVDAARFVRKAVWDKLGGLDASLGGSDDWDFQLRLNEAGYKTIRSKSYVRHYEGKLTLAKQLRKKFIYGKTADRYWLKHRDRKVMLLKQYSLFRPAFFRNWRRLLGDPLHAWGMMFLKTMEYTAAFLGLLSAKAQKGEPILK